MMTRFAFVIAAAMLATPALAESDFVLKFPANPSTGYHWELNVEASDGADLVVIEKLGNAPPESDMLGAPAPELIGVTCTGAGPVRLVFEYISPGWSSVGETRATELSCD